MSLPSQPMLPLPEDEDGVPVLQRDQNLIVQCVAALLQQVLLLPETRKEAADES